MLSAQVLAETDATRGLKFTPNALSSMKATIIGDGAFFNNDPTNVAFLGNFGAFSLDIVTSNLDLASVTYCQGAAGWPQTFMRAEKDSLTAEEVDCAAPVPAVTPLATAGWPGQAAVGPDRVALPHSF